MIGVPLTCADVSWAYPRIYLVALVDDRSRTTVGILVLFQLRYLGVLDFLFLSLRLSSKTVWKESFRCSHS